MPRLKFDPTKFGNSDPREMPAYGIPLAAHYLRIPAATVRSWVVGRNYETGDGTKWFEPLIALPDPDRRLLSFFNLAEAHVLGALRRDHNIKLQDIRRALDFLANRYDSPHPLIDHQFETNGIAIFVNELGQMLDVSAKGQLVMRSVIEQHLQRLERENQVVARLYPFTRGEHGTSPKSVFIDARYSFGRPVLARAQVATAIVAERYKAGESILDLAEDYACPGPEIEEAIRCELRLEAA